MLDRLRDALTEPELRGIDPDSPDFTVIHRRVVERKAAVRAVFAEFCRRCRSADEKYFAHCEGKIRSELGSGAGIMKELYPDVITSDVKPLPFIDLIARAEELPFRPGSVRAIYGVNLFHHLSDPRAFFRELVRVAAPGGGAVLIEPYYGPVARLLFARLFRSEGYDLAAATWESHGRDQPASDANQALSFVVLRRDRAQWQQEFPELEIVVDEPHTHLTYLASGGVNFKQLVPDRVWGAVTALERGLRPLDRYIALQHTIVIRRRGP